MYIWFVGSAGLMYWGDGKLFKIEMAYINGTGRRILLTESIVSALLLHDGYIYFTDWRYV